MKILHICETMLGGVGTHLNELLPLQIEAQGLDNVRLLAPRQHVAQLPDVPQEAVETFNRSSRSAGLLGLVGRFCFLAASFRPDIIHVHSTFAGVFVRPLAWIFRFPVVYCPHGWAMTRVQPVFVMRLYGWVERQLSRITAKIIAVSQAEYETALRFGLQEDRLRVCYNGLKPECAPLVHKEWTDDRIKILFVGRLDKQKGVDVLLSAIEGLSDRFSVRVLGHRVVLDDTDLASDNFPHVDWMGWCSLPEVMAHMAVCDVLVVPSRWEGLPYVVLEAMRLSKAVIVSNVGGLPEMIEEGQTGQVFPVNDDQALRKILLGETKETLKAMGERGRERFLQRFTLGQNNASLNEIYAEMTMKSQTASSQEGNEPVLPYPRVALVCDWLVTHAGAEFVLDHLLALYPKADVYSVVNFMKPNDMPSLEGHRCFTSFIQTLPFAQKKYRGYLPLMPLAIEQLDLSPYDIVISSSHAVAKGVLTGPDQLHVSYIHSPIRYAWDLQHAYLKEVGLIKGVKSAIVRLLLHYIRLWDTRTAAGVDCMIGNSHFIARRIHKAYHRKADVIYPPVDVDAFTLKTEKEDFYLTASRFVPYKKIPLIVEAFSKMPDKKLIVIGTGTEEKAAHAVAGPNVTFLGYQSREVMVDYMQRAKAFVFAAEEDFGIVPVEAQACGTPVIAYGKGGAKETVIDGITGLFFEKQTTASIIDAVSRMETMSFDPELVRNNAKRFSRQRFMDEFKALMDRELKKFEAHLSLPSVDLER